MWVLRRDQLCTTGEKDAFLKIHTTKRLTPLTRNGVNVCFPNLFDRNRINLKEIALHD